MKTAKEMFEISYRVAEEKLDNELTAIAEKIESAALDGNVDTYINQEITNDAKAKIKELGYKIENFCDQRDGFSYKISWRQQTDEE